MAVQQQMADAFEAASGHTVGIIPIEESDIQTRATAAFAAGDLPDVLNHTVQHLLPYAEAGLLDTAAAIEVVEDLGVDTFAYAIFSQLGMLNTLWGLLLVYPATTIPVALYMLQGYFRRPSRWGDTLGPIPSTSISQPSSWQRLFAN